MEIRRRKEDHIKICLKNDILAKYNFWDDIKLKHQSIPPRDLDSLDLGVELLGKRLNYPIIIASMTGGSPQARKYNDILARAASEFGIGMGVGSQRAGIENPDHIDSYSVIREYDVPLVLGNLGAPQFAINVKGDRYGIEQVNEAMEMVDADALCVHLNYLQEIVQPEGDTYVEGFIDRLEMITEEVKVVAKETGAGISFEDAVMLKNSGVLAIDIGGMSGTTFSGVESYRYDPTGRSSRLGKTLWNWGIPSPVSMLSANVGLPLIATGGIRNGHDVARSIALGANASGIAWKLLRAASDGYDDLKNEISLIIEELKAVMFLTGSTDISKLGKTKYVITGESRDFLDLYLKTDGNDHQ